MAREIKIIPVVCELTKASVPELERIENESNRPPWSRRLFLQEFGNEYATVYGARVEGQLVGFLVAHVAVDECHIVNFGVSARYRGKGVGRSLLMSVLRDLHRRAVRWTSLEVRKSNDVAQALYGSIGFTEAGIRERYYSDDHEDAVVMNVSVYEFIDRFGEEDPLLESA